MIAPQMVKYGGQRAMLKCTEIEFTLNKSKYLQYGGKMKRENRLEHLSESMVFSFVLNDGNVLPGLHSCDDNELKTTASSMEKSVVPILQLVVKASYGKFLRKYYLLRWCIVPSTSSQTTHREDPEKPTGATYKLNRKDSHWA